MRLNAGLMEWCGPLTHSLVRILSEKEIHLFECTAVCLYTVKASHIDDCRSYLLELVDSRNIFSRRLPHVPVNKGEFYFTSHIGFIFNAYKFMKSFI